jgi:hypothetical protein
MNPDSRFYSDPRCGPFGLAEYQPASVTFVRKVELPGYPWPCRLYITCSVGHAPRIAIDFGTADFGMAHTRAPLSLEQWRRLREAVGDCWAELEIRCSCGHPFGRHVSDPPHGCALDCSCTRFGATEPLVDEKTQLLEAK